MFSGPALASKTELDVEEECSMSRLLGQDWRSRWWCWWWLVGAGWGKQAGGLAALHKRGRVTIRRLWSAALRLQSGSLLVHTVHCTMHIRRLWSALHCSASAILRLCRHLIQCALHLKSGGIALQFDIVETLQGNVSTFIVLHTKVIVLIAVHTCRTQ